LYKIWNDFEAIIVISCNWSLSASVTFIFINIINGGIIMSGIYLPREYRSLPQYVIWSGGLDSTYLLYKVAEQFGTYDRPIQTIYLDHFQLDKKSICEKKARDELLILLRNKGLHIETNTITISATENMHHNQRGGSSQSYMWISSVLPYMKYNGVLHMGIVLGDTSIEYLHLLQDLVIVSNKIMRFEIQLSSPLLYMSKLDILSNWYEVCDRDIYKAIWYCELPIVETACGNCNSCVTHQSALIQMALKGSSWAMDQVKQFKVFPLLPSIPQYNDPRKEILSDEVDEIESRTDITSISNN
jgi:7-cyano-7-deazaguanine synthase in queuosine biosynthesis